MPIRWFRRGFSKNFNENLPVGEDIDYINRAAEIGRFRMYQELFVYVSVRRFEMEAKGRATSQYAGREGCYVSDASSI